ncbi:hypothetical protein NM688_g7427 [Phlebia brevispora]|uniref:Uncharacterized protein n=1 Tax=Phlebia brevispora TaxID=194682 RepID=A0ACC1S5A1_9APHY|nr:hypothetical protein NM688_g7427 [Phlebia brevispora]
MPTYVPPEFPIRAWEQLRTVSYTLVASMALMMYDYILTFRREVELVWASPFSLMKCLFFLTRYTPVLDLSLLAAFDLAPSLAQESCHWIHTVALQLVVIGYLIAECMGMRPGYPHQVISYHSQLFWLSAPGYYGNATVGSALCSSLKDVIMSAPYNGTEGCLVVAGSRNLPGIAYAELLAFETVLLVLILLKGVPQCGYPLLRSILFPRRSQDRMIVNPLALAIVLYRDGILFYIVLCCFSAANLIVTYRAPAELVASLTALQRVLHSSLSARVVLHLREAAKRDLSPSSSALAHVCYPSEEPRGPCLTV